LKRALKWLVGIAAAVVLLAIVAAIALPYLVDTPRVQALIATNASQAVGRPVKFTSLSIALFPLPAVELHKLEIADDPQFGTAPFLTLETLAPPKVELRIVGGPPAAGADLARRFRMVRYLGPLSDEELDKEASTWTCFVHPLFCYARGCSTKLAIALSWQIPILTTPQGCRGYTWREGSLPSADTPEAFARLALRLAEPEPAAQKEVAAIVRSAPTLNQVAALVRGALLSGGAIEDIGG